MGIFIQPPSIDGRGRGFSESVLQSELDSTPEGVLVVEASGRIVAFNRRFVEIWSLPQEVLADPDGEQFLSRILPQLTDAAAFRADVERFRLHPDDPVHRELLLRDGRVVECSSGGVRTAGGEYVGRIWFYRDVSDRKKAETELRRANDLLTAQIESSPDGVLVVGPDREIVLYNRRFLELWDVPEDVAQSRSDERALASVIGRLKDPAAFMARLGELYADPTQRSHEELELTDGRVFERYSEPLPLGPREAYGRIFFFRDITDRKNTERGLAQERDMSAALIASMPGYLVLVDDQGRLIAWNENVEKLTGRSGDELRNAHFSELIVEEDRARAFTTFVSAMRAGSGSGDFAVTSASGERRAMLVTLRRIEREGEPFVLTVAVDVTETRRATALLAESESRFRAIFDAVSDGIIVHDLETGAFIGANSRVCQMFGYTRDELLRLDVAGLSVDDSEQGREAIARLLRGARDGSAQTFEWHARAKDGHTFWIEASLRRARFGSDDFLLSTAHDITERKRASVILPRLVDSLVTLPRSRTLASSSLQ